MKYNKILDVDDLNNFNKNKKNKIVVLCHGVFDLVHIGHIKHFEDAKSHGDILVVSVTTDIYVNKRPDGPFLDINKRLEYLTHLDLVDYVVVSKNNSAIEIINYIKPNFYAKGIEYKNLKNDSHGNLRKEIKAVTNFGGKIIYTNKEVSSSSFIVNNLKKDLNKIWYLKAKKSINIDEVIKISKKIKKLKICVIGENISDIYIYSNPLGRSSKNSSLVVQTKNKEVIAGGSEALANNLETYCDSVTLLTQSLTNVKNIKFKKEIFQIGKIIEKSRIIDNHTQVTLLQTYNDANLIWSKEKFLSFKKYLKKNKFDIIVCIDFGHGFFTKEVVKYITQLDTFLSLNVQTNAGNRGYNLITKWPKSDYLTITDEELKLAMQDNNSDLKHLVKKLKKYHKFKMINITMGNKGSVIFKNLKTVSTPAFVTKEENIVDRVGAGDSLFASTIGFAYLNSSLDIIGAVGNIAGALNLTFRANKTKITLEKIIKSLSYLLK